jgi:hypothetical protein
MGAGEYEMVMKSGERRAESGEPEKIAGRKITP